MTSTLRQQADYVALTGREIADQIEAMRRKPGREAEAALRETRLPILRDAYSTLDKLAKAQSHG